MKRADLAISVQHVENPRAGNYYEVTVSAGSGEYARTSAKHLDLALQMAVPYMVYACEPDPFVDLLSAHGSAREQAETERAV